MNERMQGRMNAEMNECVQFNFFSQHIILVKEACSINAQCSI